MEERLKDIIQFIVDALRKTDGDNLDKYSSLLSLVNEYTDYRDKVKNKYPYHVNPIEELHADENANSRILCSMLRYQVDGDYKILKSFLNCFFPDASFNVSNDLVIEPEQYRIDLSIRDKKGRFALIFENKIHDAVLQKNQLARYITKLRNDEGFKDEEIYVVFLPSSNNYEPNDCCWYEPSEECNNCNGDCKLKGSEPPLRKRFVKNGHYRKVTFREDIMRWLKEDVLPNLLYKETLLQATVFLYIDYLEGLFNLRAMDKDMNMEIENYIIEKLKLNEYKNGLEKICAMDECYTQINCLLEKINGIQNGILKIKEEEEQKQLSNIDELKDNMTSQIKFNCSDLMLEYKNYWIYIGVHNKTRIYYSIKSDNDMRGKGTPDKKLEIFNQTGDKYNSLGWQDTGERFWGSRADFFKLKSTNPALWEKICDWIQVMKKAIDELSNASL